MNDIYVFVCAYMRACVLQTSTCKCTARKLIRGLHVCMHACMYAYPAVQRVLVSYVYEDNIYIERERAGMDVPINSLPKPFSNK